MNLGAFEKGGEVLKGLPNVNCAKWGRSPLLVHTKCVTRAQKYRTPCIYYMVLFSSRSDNFTVCSLTTKY